VSALKSVFLLGPDEWAERTGRVAPTWVSSELGGPITEYTPKTLRLALAAAIERESGGKCSAIVMDRALQHDGEDDADFFQRLEIEHRPDSYFFVFPAGAKILGIVFEAGMLVRDFAHGQSPQMVMFAERPIVMTGANGSVEFRERGNRTRYLRSVARRAKHLQIWESTEDLREVVLQRALIDV
jgi:hypothetical protein